MKGVKVPLRFVFDSVTFRVFKYLLWPLVKSNVPSYKRVKVQAAVKELRHYLKRVALLIVGVRTDPQRARVPEAIERAYDSRIAQGLFIDYFVERESWYLLNGTPVLSTWSKARPYFQQQFAKLLSGLDIKSVLEVGGGELTKLMVMRDVLGKDVQYFSIDLSFGRCWEGYHREKGLFSSLFVAKANATALPFQDCSVDLVYSYACLELMPRIYKQAINEMVRVARKHVLIMEPSFELGDIVTKIIILGKNNVRGINSYLMRQSRKQRSKIHLRGHDILPTQGSPAYLFAYHLIDVATGDSAGSQLDISSIIGCPVCKKPLAVNEHFYYCEACKLVFQIFDGIPNLDSQYALNFDIHLTNTVR